MSATHTVHHCDHCQAVLRWRGVGRVLDTLERFFECGHCLRCYGACVSCCAPTPALDEDYCRLCREATP